MKATDSRVDGGLGGAVLVGIDERSSAQDALALGRWLVEMAPEDLFLAWVHPYDQLPSLLGDEEDATRVRETVNTLASAVKSALPAELRSELHLLSGRSASQGLQQLAERENVSVIVLGASERSGMGRIAPGKTAIRLLSGSRVPVAVAPRGYEAPSGEAPLIGVGFNGGPEAEAALKWSAAFAQSVGGRLRVIAVHEPMAFGGVGVGTFPTASVSQVLHQQLQRETEDAVAGLDVPAEVVLGDGSAAAVLAGQTAELDLLVLGSRGYGPLRSVLLGTVSEATVAEAQSPVLIVPRPD
jgi:nucleotide-binding universal stress UspA family protein